MQQVDLPRPGNTMSIGEFRRRATPGWRNFCIAAMLHGVALIFGLIAPAVAWETFTFVGVNQCVGSKCFSGAITLSVGALFITVTCASGGGYSCNKSGVTVPNPASFGGAIIIYIGMFFTLAAIVVCAIISARLRRLAATGELTKQQGCCSATIQAANAVGFTGFSVALLGFAICGIICGAVSYYLSVGGVASTTGPGVILCAMSVVLTLTGSIVGAATGCQLGPLAGVADTCCGPPLPQPYTVGAASVAVIAAPNNSQAYYPAMSASNGQVATGNPVYLAAMGSPPSVKALQPGPQPYPQASPYPQQPMQPYPPPPPQQQQPMSPYPQQYPPGMPPYQQQPSRGQILPPPPPLTAPQQLAYAPTPVQHAPATSTGEYDPKVLIYEVSAKQ